MASAESVVVGGGVASGSPFTLGRLVYVTNVAPPQVSTYGPKVFADGAVTVTSFPDSTGAYNAAAGATETVRIQGGLIVSGSGTDSVQIGRAAVANATGAVVIGQGVSANGHTGVFIGYAAGATTITCGGILVGAGSHLIGNGGGAAAICVGSNSTAQNSGAGGGETLCIGNNSVSSQGDVVIGSNATSTSNTATDPGNVIVGQTAIANAAGRGCVLIGNNTNAGAKLSIIVGQASTIGTGIQNIILGQNAEITGAIANSIVIGTGSSIGASGSGIVLGNGLATAAALTAWIGGPNTKIRTLVIGEGDTVATPPDRTIRCTNATGPDNAASGLIVVAPLSTGAAVAASISLQTGVAAGSSSTLQTPTTQFQVDGDSTATFTRMLVYVVDTGTLQRVQTINNAAIQTLTGLATARLLYVAL